MPKKNEGASQWKMASIIARVNLVFLRGTIVVLVALLPLSCCQTNGEVYDLNSYQSRHTLSAEGTGQGILLFAYGTEKTTTDRYLREAFVGARRIKALNPTANITLVTNPGLHPTIDGAFDLVINIDPKDMIPGKAKSGTSQAIPRQWLTRIEYLSRSPYEV